MKLHKNEEARDLGNYVNIVSAAYTVYFSACENKENAISREDFLEAFLENQEFFKGAVAEKVDKAEKEVQLFDDKRAKQELDKGMSEAKEILEDEDKMERFLQKLEKKLKIIPFAGEKLADVPVMASLVRSYAKKEYTEIPLGSIIAVISALLYVLSPIDIIPDGIPVVGYFDDGLVVAACVGLVENDLKEYVEWRKENGKEY